MKRFLSVVSVLGSMSSGACMTAGVDDDVETSSAQQDVKIGSLTPFAHFGAAFAAGDFNGDGFTDLAVSAPDAGAGEVFLYSGSSTGLKPWRAIKESDISAVTTGVGDEFGAALAAADIDGDGMADLVIGAPQGQAVGTAHGGVVYVMFSVAGTGLNGGPSVGHTDVLDQHTLIPNEGDSDDDDFGASLALRTVTNGNTWLAIGVPGEGTGLDHYGFVNVVKFGDKTIPSEPGRVPSSMGTVAPPTNVDGAQFGASVLIRDLDNDGHRDIIVGAPGKKDGKVFVYRGTGTSFDSAIEVDENSSLPMAATDGFGTSIAEGQFEAVHYDNKTSEPFLEELMIAAPDFNQGQGRVFRYVPVISNGKLTAMKVASGFSSASGEFGGGDALSHPFAGGTGLVVRDFDGDGLDDLITSAPMHGSDTGELAVLINSLTNGLSLTTTLSWTASPGSDGMIKLPSPDDEYGLSLAVGDFRGNGSLDLVGGMPNRSTDGGAGDPQDTTTQTGAFFEYFGEGGGSFLPVKLFDEGTQ